MKRILTSALITLLSTTILCAQEIIEYEWTSVPITGGGFVPGVVFSTKDEGVRYCRTDMGGAYKWIAEKGEWQQLLDFLSYDDSNLQGVESIAIDPNNSQHVMMACGTGTRTPGAVLITHDGFKTLHRTDVPFGFGGNDNGNTWQALEGQPTMDYTTWIYNLQIYNLRCKHSPRFAQSTLSASAKA